jgi:hypothetical protein
MADFIVCPVSFGELFDKISILDIKKKYITNISKRDDVEKEFNILINQIQNKITEHQYFYNLLFKINEDIWHLMDSIRSINIDTDKELWINLCKKTIDYNDIRFRIKNKINYICKSSIKEQKSYTPSKYLIQYTNYNLNKFKILIMYNSIIFDNVDIYCSSDNYSILKEEFQSDFTINIIVNTVNDNNVDIDSEYIRLNDNSIFNYIKMIL